MKKKENKQLNALFTHLQTRSVRFELQGISPNSFLKTGFACILQLLMTAVSFLVHPVYASGVDKDKSTRLNQNIE